MYFNISFNFPQNQHYILSNFIYICFTESQWTFCFINIEYCILIIPIKKEFQLYVVACVALCWCAGLQPARRPAAAAAACSTGQAWCPEQGSAQGSRGRQGAAVNGSWPEPEHLGWSEGRLCSNQLCDVEIKTVRPVDPCIVIREWLKISKVVYLRLCSKKTTSREMQIPYKEWVLIKTLIHSAPIVHIL